MKTSRWWVALALGMAVVVDGGKGGGGRDRGHGGGVGGKGGVSGKGSRKDGCKGGGRQVLIFDILLISLHFSQTIIPTISYL